MGDDESIQPSSMTNIYLGGITGLVSFLTTFFNGISLSHLLLLLKRDSSKGKNSTTILYINLGICDFLQGIVSALSAITLLSDRVLPSCLSWFCPISASCVEILPAMGLFITMYVLGIKCVVFYMPLRSKQLIRYRSTLVIVVLVWVSKILYSLVRQVLYGSDYWADLTVCVAGDYFRNYNFIFYGGLAVNLPILFTFLFTVVLILKVKQRHADRQDLMRAAMQAVKKTRVTVSKFPENFVAEVYNPLSANSEPIILQCFTHSQPSTATVNLVGRSKHKNKRVRAHSVAYTIHPMANNPYNLPSICSASYSHRSTPTSNTMGQYGKSQSWNNITSSRSDPSLDVSKHPEKRGNSVDSTASGISCRRRSSSMVDGPKIDLKVQSVSSLDTDENSHEGFSSNSSDNTTGINPNRLSVTSIDGGFGSSEDVRVMSSSYRSLKNYLQKKHSLVSIASMSIGSKRPSRVSSSSIRPRYSVTGSKRHSLVGGLVNKFSSDSTVDSISPRSKRHSVTLVSFIDGQLSVSSCSIGNEEDLIRPSGHRKRTASEGAGIQRSFSSSPRIPMTRKQVRRITRIKAEEVHMEKLTMNSNLSHSAQSIAEIAIKPQQGMVTKVPEIVLAPTTPTTDESSNTEESKRSTTIGPAVKKVSRISLSVVSPSQVQQIDSPETPPTVNSTIFSAPSSQPSTKLTMPKVQPVLRSPARELARQQRLARRRASANARPNLSDIAAAGPLVRQHSDQTGLNRHQTTCRQNSDSSSKSLTVGASRDTSADQAAGPVEVKKEQVKPEQEKEETKPKPSPPSQSVDVIALKYSTFNNPARHKRHFTFGMKRRTTIAVDNLQFYDSPLRLSSNDLTYGTETERDIEAAQNFIKTHQKKDQPHIIPMWNKRSEHGRTAARNSVNKDQRVTKRKFVQSPDGEGGFDPLLRRYERKAPYFIDSSQYPSLTKRDPLLECNDKARRKESRAEQNERNDFVLLGLNLGGGFIKRNVNKSLQKRMQLKKQNSSGESMRALKTSILVALNITIFYSLFFYVWLVQTLHRYTELNVQGLVFDLNDKIHVLGPLYIIFLPTLSSLLDPVIYFCNKAGVNLLSDQGQGAGNKRIVPSKVNPGQRQRRVGRVQP